MRYLGLLAIACLFFSLTLPLAAQIPADFILAAENDYLALYIHHDTTEIALWDKTASTSWFSNPEGRNRRQGIAHDVIQIRYDAPTSPDKLMNSYAHSVQLGQANIFPIAGGVRVEYLFGSEYTDNIALVPQMIKAGIFEQEILSQVTQAEQNILFRYYTPIMLRDPYPFELSVTSAAQRLEKQLFADLIVVPVTEDYDTLVNNAQFIEQQLAESNYSAEEQQQLTRELQQIEDRIADYRMDVLYGLLEKFTGYLLGSGEGGRSIGYRHDITSTSDLGLADFSHLREEPSYLLGRLAPLLQDQVERIFHNVNYRIEDLARDHVQNRLDPPVPSVERFFIPVEYYLDGQALVVQIPMDEVVYPRNQPTVFDVNWDGTLGSELLIYDHTRELETYPLTSIALMRYFGAADSEGEGYIFVPDGSGAIIHLNNNKLSQALYSEPVYGRDGALPTSEQLAYQKRKNHLPIFGMKVENKAFLAVIEEGEAIAQIRADIARPTTPYNIAYAAFQTISKATRRLDQFTQINLYQSRPYQGNIRIRYEFLYDEEANFNGMARRYQEYLVERDQLTSRIQGDGIPFFLEVIGVVPKREPVLGIAREVQLPLTTFEQAQAMVTELLNSGVNNLSLRYSGWLKGGINHIYPTGVHLAPGLGGADGFASLVQYLRENNVTFYPAVEFLKVQRSGLLQGFIPQRDAARAVNGLYATLPEFDPVTNKALPQPTRYILASRVLPKLVDDFLAEYRPLNVQGLAVPSLGEEVHSDLQRNQRQVVDRVQAAIQIGEQLNKLVAAGLTLQVDGGNALAIPYASSILGVPQTSTGYNLVDGEVPFLQMVLHGFVDYAGEPLNLAVDRQESILRAAQTASGLSMQLIWADASVLKETEYAHLLSVQGDYWLSEAVQIYEKYNRELGDLAKERIEEFHSISPELTLTRFSNGDEVIVNFGHDELEYAGTMIPAREFVRLRGVR